MAPSAAEFTAREITFTPGNTVLLQAKPDAGNVSSKSREEIVFFTAKYLLISRLIYNILLPSLRCVKFFPKLSD